MENFHFRVPVTLDVRLDVGDPVARVQKWRPYPKNPQSVFQLGEQLLVRFKLNNEHADLFFVCFFNGFDLCDCSGRTLFIPEGCTKDDLNPDIVNDELVFIRNAPDVIHWIPLAELLEGIEEAES